MDRFALRSSDKGSDAMSGFGVDSRAAAAGRR
jgi:hypothetical protein